MSKFNEVQKNSTKTTSYEGGTVYEKSLEDEWSNMLFSCMLQNGFYESSDEVEKRYIDLTEKMIDKRGPEWVCKAACFSRNVLGLRSISEITAAIINRHQFEKKRKFFANYFHRPDGVGEVFAAVKHLGDKRSHALVRGAADYLSTLSEYQVGKYQMSRHDFNMHDLINLTHAYSEVLDKYQKGELSAPDTWEVKISTASPEAKEGEWKRLVETNKLGYLALIRNLRNITACKFADDDWCKEYLYSQLTNEAAIEKSLVFPYQIYCAWKNSRENLPIIVELALSDAFKLSTANMPGLEGQSAIILDVSGSMNSMFNRSLRINEICSVYAAAIYWKNKETSTTIKFGSYAKVFDNYGKYKNIFKLIDALMKNDGVGHGTDIISAFEALDKSYDRLFLFSDMQCMDENGYWWGRSSSKTAQQAFDEYVKSFGDTQLYSFDLGNYHSQIVSQNHNIKYITTLTDMVFTAIELNEREGQSLVDIVEDYSFEN